MLRRDFIRAGAALPLLFNAWPCQVLAQSRVKPTWLSFGLNTPAGNVSRFPLSAELLQKRGGKRDPQLEVSQNIAQVLRNSGDLVEFRDAVDMGSGPLLGAVLDYENVLSARLGTSSFIVLHLVGHGVVLNFDAGRGWKMASSFPFPVTLLRESEGGDPQAEAQKYLMEAYTGRQNSFATSFVKAAQRTAPRWKESSGRNFNVRFMSSTLHPEVETKLASWKLSKHINAVWLGHLASAAACEGLGIPVVPYGENQAMGKFTYKFSDRLTAQNVRLPDENDIDLRLHVTLRNIGREVKYRNQLQRWEVNRMVVIEVKGLNDQNKEVLSLRFGYQDDVPDTLAREEDLVPARDAHFFDMAIYRGLVSFFAALDSQDKGALARLFIKAEGEQQKQIENFKAVYQRAI